MLHVCAYACIHVSLRHSLTVASFDDVSTLQAAHARAPLFLCDKPVASAARRVWSVARCSSAYRYKMAAAGAAYSRTCDVAHVDDFSSRHGVMTM